ncbi:MAG: Ig-like domain-containing protein, partial [Armatimonadota bacterium]
MRSWVVVILVGLLVALPSAPVGAIGLPAGTTFQVVAEATYMDSSGTLYNADPAWVTLTVEQVARVSVEGSGPTGEAVPGQDTYIPIRIVNLGNGIDSFSLVAGSSRGWNVAVVYDDNGDGIHQPTENYVITTAGPAVADGYSPCFARVTVPTNADSGDTVTIAAVSNYDPAAADQVQFPLTVPAAPGVLITNPTGDPAFTVTKPSIDIGGTTSGGLPIAKVEWATDRGATGTCAGTSSWAASGIPLQRGSNVITVTATDTAGRTATDTLTVTYVDAVPPTVSITSPTTAATYTTNASLLNIAGTASDDVAVVSVTWSNDRGGSGTCSGTSSWSASGIGLQSGQNVITVTASDAAGNTGSAVLTVTYEPPKQGDEDTTSPTVSITSPTTAATYTTNASLLNIAGTAS